VNLLSHAYQEWTPSPEQQQTVAARIVTHDGDSLTWRVEAGHVHVDLPWWDFEASHLSEASLSPEQPTYSRLPVPYTLIPFGLRTKLNRARIANLRRQHEGEADFPADPVETRLDTFRRDIWTAAAELAGVTLEGRAPEKTLVLTHDLDEDFGWSGVQQLRAVEREFGVSSSVGVLSKRYTLPESHLQGLVDDGCEIYSHGYLHDGLLPYLAVDELRQRLGHFFEAYPSMRGLVRGFRSGQLVRSRGMFEVVAEFFGYDMSPPTVELGGAHGWRTGCATTIPFDGPGGLAHLPLTMPQDYYLAMIDNLGATAIAGRWLDVAREVWQAGGVAVHLVHPDNVKRRPALLTAYRLFLEGALDAGAVVRLPGDVMTKRGVSR
jgi:hypothetical protein